MDIVRIAKKHNFFQNLNTDTIHTPAANAREESQRPYWDACCPQMAIN
jgi:hypothetical protein